MSGMSFPRVGDRVAVHFNLAKGGWSLKATTPSGKSIGALIAHLPEVALEDVEFVVHANTHKRIIDRNRRTVCAWMVGRLALAETPSGAAVEVAYNPFRSPDFTTREGACITRADRVEFALDGRAYASNPKA